MNSLRAFISGSFIPAVVTPFILTFAVYSLHKPEVLQVLFVHYLPIIWGVWNVLYFLFLKNILPGNENAKLLIHGAVLGLILAVFGIFWIGLPQIMGLTGIEIYFPLIGAPIAYALMWRFMVKPLNRMVGIINWN